MDIHLEKQVWGHTVEGLKCHLLILSISIYSVLVMCQVKFCCQCQNYQH